MTIYIFKLLTFKYILMYRGTRRFRYWQLEYREAGREGEGEM